MLRQLEEREKRAIRRALGTRKPHDRAMVNHGDDLTIKKTRDFLAPMKAGYVPPKPRGRSHVAMGAKARAALAVRANAREKFFAALRGGE